MTPGPDTCAVLPRSPRERRLGASSSRARNAVRHASLRSRPVTRWLTGLVGLALLLLAAPASHGQSQSPSTSPSGDEPSRDTAPRTPSESSQASASPEQLEEPVEFSAEDSLVLRFDGDGNRAVLTGQSAVSYQQNRLEAHRIELSMSENVMGARGVRTDTGWVGRPTFSRDQESFSGDSLAFNLQTNRGRIVEARTSFQDGWIGGRVIKRDVDSVLYVDGAMYSTCPLRDDPHYHLEAGRMKVVNQRWIFTGPLHLELYNIPLPIWLPFGFLPAQATRRSGILPPSYGEDERGFFLRDWGYYWALNPYMDFQVQFGLWSKGSWQINPRFRYSKRYEYDGSINLDWVRNKRGEELDPDYRVVDSRSFRWNHNQTVNPTTNLSANVDLSSRGYLRTVSEQYDDRVRQSVSSTMSLSKRWPDAGRSLSLSLRQNQVLAQGSASLTMPSLSFSQQSRRPFRSEQPTPGGPSWYERITYSYRGRVTNRYDFDPLSAEELREAGDSAAADIGWWDGLRSADAHRRATGESERFDFQATHEVPVSASFSTREVPLIGWQLPLNLSPRISYSEEWHLRTRRRGLDPAGNRVVTESVPGFFSFRELSTGVSANTEFFGVFPWRVGRFDGFRHVVRPSWSLSYQPDYSSDFWGYYRSYEDTSGVRRTYPIVPGIPSGTRQTLSFNLTNVFQTRLLQPDTAASSQGSSRTIQLFTLDLNTSYNFAADSLRLAPISLSGRTRILDLLDLNASATFNPYVTDARGRVIDRFQWSEGIFPARLTQLRISTSTRFSGSTGGDDGTGAAGTTGMTGPGSPGPTGPGPAGGGGLNTGPPPPGPGGAGPQTSGFGGGGRWSLALNGNYSYSRRGDRTDQRAVLNTRFQLPITSSMSVQGNTGFDFVDRELVSTSIQLQRDLHCWQMSLYWVPIGRGQTFRFTLRVKSGHLADLLKLQVPQSGVRDRFSLLGD